jgi:hypothetical protein
LRTIFNPLDNAKKRGGAEARDLGDRLMEGLSLLEIFVDSWGLEAIFPSVRGRLPKSGY